MPVNKEELDRRCAIEANPHVHVRVGITFAMSHLSCQHRCIFTPSLAVTFYGAKKLF